jgi:hypothetical protein
VRAGPVPDVEFPPIIMLMLSRRPRQSHNRETIGSWYDMLGRLGRP